MRAHGTRRSLSAELILQTPRAGLTATTCFLLSIAWVLIRVSQDVYADQMADSRQYFGWKLGGRQKKPPAKRIAHYLFAVGLHNQEVPIGQFYAPRVYSWP